MWKKDEWESTTGTPYPDQTNTNIRMIYSDKDAFNASEEFRGYCETPKDTILINIGIDKKDDPMESRISFCWLSLVKGRLLPQYGECLLHNFDPYMYTLDITNFHSLV
jgi:hypothetical protein